MTPTELKEARRELGLTLSQMAAALGVSARHVRRYEAPVTASTSRTIPRPVVKLVRAMLAGFKP